MTDQPTAAADIAGPIPEEKRSCVCVSIDGRECIRIRYGRPHPFMCDEAADMDPEPCECSCHEPSEDDDWR